MGMTLTNQQIAKDRAWKYAEADFYYGMKPRLSEWGIKEDSAMASWYWARRKQLQDRPKEIMKEVDFDSMGKRISPQPPANGAQGDE